VSEVNSKYLFVADIVFVGGRLQFG